jgi:hypothetical protein
MVLTYFLNAFEMVPVAPIITGITLVFTFHIRGTRAHHVTRHNTLIHNTPSTAPQLSISQKALGTLPEDGNVMPKYVGATIHN